MRISNYGNVWEHRKALEQIVFDGIEENATKKAQKQAELDGKYFN